MVSGIRLESFLLAKGFSRPFVGYFRIIDAADLFEQACSPFAKPLCQRRLRNLAQIRNAPKILLVKEALALGADPGDDSKGKRVQKVGDLHRLDDGQTVRLLPARGDFGDKLVGSDTDRAAESLAVTNLSLEFSHSIAGGGKVF